MRVSRQLVGLLACLGTGLLLAACASTSETTPVHSEAEGSTTVQTVSFVLPTAIPAETDYCLECHKDQQMLIDTAKPEEEVISENEGAG